MDNIFRDGEFAILRSFITKDGNLQMDLFFKASDLSVTLVAFDAVVNNESEFGFHLFVVKGGKLLSINNKNNENVLPN